MHRMILRRVAPAGALILALALPAAAQAAATKPGVQTRGTADITPSTATLTGAVDPNGAETRYLFQYGTTSSYGAVTTETPLTGDGSQAVVAPITGLAPATTYHYRLIARNAKGTTQGADRTFKTTRQPLGVTFSATPNPLAFGATTTLAGQLTGTGNAGREIQLQSNPFPYTQGFKQVGNALITDPAGNFSFGLQAVPFNTQYRVLLPDNLEVVSPIVVVSVSIRVGTTLGTTTVTRGHQLTFKGSVTPAVDGTPIAIQKLNGSNWVTVAGTAARHSTTTKSTYSKKVTIKRGGHYRVYVGVANGQYVPATGREIVIHTHK
jgi:hypothetical protein